MNTLRVLRSLFFICLLVAGFAACIVSGLYLNTASQLPALDSQLDLEKLKIREIQEEVDRHSRILRRKEELAG